MSSSAAITGKLTITTNSVAKVYNSVTQLNFDFFHGTVGGVDGDLGPFNFGLTAATTVTYIIAGTVSTIVIS